MFSKLEKLFYLFFPFIGFIIAFVFYLRKKDDKSQEVLFFSGLGFFFNIILGIVLLFFRNVF